MEIQGIIMQVLSCYEDSLGDYGRAGLRAWEGGSCVAQA